MISVVASATQAIPIDLLTLKSVIKAGASIVQQDIRNIADYPSTFAEAYAIILRTGRVSEAELDYCEKLRIIVSHGTGVDAIDLRACQKRNVRVCNTPLANTQSVVELTVGLMLSCLRSIPQSHVRLTQSGDWTGAIALGNELAGKTVGLIGYGATGKGVAKLCKSIGSRVIATRRNLHLTDSEEFAELVKLDELLVRAEIVSLHLPLNHETKGMVDHDFLNRMKPGAILINTARGALVEEPALLKALDAGVLRGAALDVFSPEPPDLRSAIFRNERIIVTPHLAGATEEALRNIARMAAVEIDRCFGGLSPLNEVTSE